MKKTLVISAALVGILAAASGPVIADSITERVPRASLLKFCADKADNSRNSAQLSLADGSVVKGFIKCVEDDLARMSSNDSFHSSDDDYDDDDDDHDDDDKRYDDRDHDDDNDSDKYQS